MNKHIPIRFNDPGYHAGIESEHLCLHYTIEPTGSTQQRFRDRLVAKPKINLSDYEFSAVYDWIEICLKTDESLPGHFFKRKLSDLNDTFGGCSNCYFSGPTRNDKYRGQQHVVRLFDPQPAGLKTLLSEFIAKHCQSSMTLSQVLVTGLELSLDVAPSRTLRFEPKSYAVRRMLMKELIVKHCFVSDTFEAKKRRLPRFTYKRGDRTHTHPIIGKPRGKKGAKLAIEEKAAGIPSEVLKARLPALHRQPLLDATWYYGDEKEQMHFRCMDKKTDHRNGDLAVPLPINETRARIEVTMLDVVPLDGKGPKTAGIEKVGGFADRPLKRFNKLFKFCYPTFDCSKADANFPDGNEWDIFSKSGIAGLYRKQESDDLIFQSRERRKAKSRREDSSLGKLLAYSEFNGRVAKAIGKLDERWARDWERGLYE